MRRRRARSRFRRRRRPDRALRRHPKARSAPNINAKLRALLPNNPVNPTTKQYTLNYSLRGRLEPTPPPDVLAKTKYIYEVRRTGNEARVKMWVTDARKGGTDDDLHGMARALSTGRSRRLRRCSPARQNVQNDVHAGPANGTQITIGGGGERPTPLSPFAAGLTPIVDGIVSQPCDGRLLVPFAPSPVSSP